MLFNTMRALDKVKGKIFCMKKGLIWVLTIIISLFMGIYGTIIVTNYMEEDNVVTNKKVSITEQDSIKEAIDKVYDAVVVIEVYNGNEVVSTGTGFVYKKNKENGYIITNHHVIESNGTIKVTNTAGNTVEAKLLGSDEYADVAVLSVEQDAALKTVEIGNTTDIELGDTVFTVGSPLGADYMGTVTKGILSGKNRTVTVSLKNGNFVMEVLQTDAAINPGNSGGPLLNINGEVIGVNSLKLVQDQIEGMGFSIPIEMVMSSVEKLEKGEKIDHPVIGVEMLDVDNPYALFYHKIALDDKIESGVVVVNVVENYPAEEAGLKKGDVIVGVDDTEITNSAYLRFTLYKYNVGDKIKVKYIRDGKLKDTTLELDRSADE